MPAIVVAGLGYGDEGKGAAVEHLARRHGATLVVRYNGGPQCGHNVVLADGRHHTFAQFGSATLAGAATHLSRHMLINPANMAREAAHLVELGVPKPFDLLTVDESCVVITPFQRALNRLAEWNRGAKAHGSCGQGVGQARSDQIEYGDRVLYARDLLDEKAAKQKLSFVQRAMRDKMLDMGDFSLGPEAADQIALLFYDGAVEQCWQAYRKVPLRVVPGDYLKLLVERHRSVIFEGAQGVLLDETHGAAPHNTWTDTTCGNANTLLRELGYDGAVRRIGVLRTYHTRHGCGPFETEDWRIGTFLPEPHNDGAGFQGAFRVGHFDAVAARFALRVSGGVSEIALNHLDAIGRLKAARIRVSESRIGSLDLAPGSYESYAVPSEFAARVEQLLGVPITVVASGPTAQDRSEHAVAEAA